ncbi:MAG: hypothetical protein QOI50_4334 [Pseudonocardiales bacterium]|jgi:hypothetical protein|nr:hypothetical protein [Pseudonocardiales bacterium]MDT7751276.1 hypothetical protein [Pseudonocardiales bacterium]
MTTQAKRATAAETDETVDKKIQRLRELYADAPELGTVASRCSRAVIRVVSAFQNSTSNGFGALPSR